MKRKEENRSVIEPSCTFFKPNKINFLPSNQVLDRKPDRVTGYKVLIDLTSLVFLRLSGQTTNVVKWISVNISLTELQSNLSMRPPLLKGHLLLVLS